MPYPAAAYAGGFYTVRHDALAFVGADGALWLVPVPSGGKARASLLAKATAGCAPTPSKPTSSAWSASCKITSYSVKSVQLQSRIRQATERVTKIVLAGLGLRPATEQR